MRISPDLLSGRFVIAAGPLVGFEALGAEIDRWEDPGSLTDDSVLRDAVAAVSRFGRVDAALVDLVSVFSAQGAAGLDPALDCAWCFARGVAVGAMIENGGGTIVLSAPSSSLGPEARAAAAGIANIAKSLGTEWARFDVRVVAVCPRSEQPDAMRELFAWLCSDAGSYLTGCRLEPGDMDSFG